MPILLCIIEFVDFDAPKIIFLISHHEDIHTIQSLI